MQSQCLLFLLLLLLSVKLLSAEFAAVSELSAEKFNGTKVFFFGGGLVQSFDGGPGPPSISNQKHRP